MAGLLPCSCERCATWTPTSGADEYGLASSLRPLFDTCASEPAAGVEFPRDPSPVGAGSLIGSAVGSTSGLTDSLTDVGSVVST
jgi:hypothetical protein